MEENSIQDKVDIKNKANEVLTKSINRMLNWCVDFNYNEIFKLSDMLNKSMDTYIEVLRNEDLRGNDVFSTINEQIDYENKVLISKINLIKRKLSLICKHSHNKEQLLLGEKLFELQEMEV